MEQQHIVKYQELMLLQKLELLMKIMIDGFVDLLHIIQLLLGMVMIKMKLLNLKEQFSRTQKNCLQHQY